MQLLAEALEAACPHVPDVLAHLLHTRTGTQGTQFPFTDSPPPCPGLWAVCLLVGSRGWEVPQGWSFYNPQGNGLSWGLRSFT